jgi:hypothetical protein
MIGKRSRRWLAGLAAAAALAATTMVSASAYASASVDGGNVYVATYSLSAPDPVTGAKSSFNPDWIRGGKCVLYPEALVVISPPDSGNNGWGAFHGTTYTNRSEGATMGGSFRILDHNGNQLAHVDMNSGYMPQRLVAYGFDYYQPMFMTPANFFFAEKIEWTVGC